MNDFLSDYSIMETIGKGTFSIVKLGINKKTKEKVAIKILKKKENNTQRRCRKNRKRNKYFTKIKSYKCNKNL